MAECAILSCCKPVRSRGWCQTHYTRWKRHGDPEIVLKRGGILKRGVQPCGVRSCERDYYAKGYCQTHYLRWRKHGTPAASIPIRRTEAPENYRVVTLPDGMDTLEHRHIMQQEIGRPLLPDETVHHKNGQRRDNRIENLELWSSRHPKGQRVEDKVDWALEILSLYAPEHLGGSGG